MTKRKWRRRRRSSKRGPKRKSNINLAEEKETPPSIKFEESSTVQMCPSTPEPRADKTSQRPNGHSILSPGTAALAENKEDSRDCRVALQLISQSGESSDSDVELVRPRHVKRRRMLPGTLPAPVSVYSNKVNSCLKLPPNDSSTLAQMAKELQRVHGPEDLESESATEPPLTKNNKPQVYDVSDSEGEGRLDTQQARLRDASPSPPPTPENRTQRRGRAYRKIREVEAQLKDLGTFLSPSHKSITENDVIIVGSSPAPELTVKVRRRGELFRINLHTFDPLQKLAESVASQLHVETSQVLLLLRDEELKHTQTPHSLNLTVADIIDCVVISPSEAPEAENQSEEKICLQVQGKEKPSHLTVTLGKTEPLQSLMDQYKAAKGLTQKDKISFIFEGKKLKGKSTAEDLGLESDDIIEVWV